LPANKVFIAYIDNDYGTEVARSVDECLSRHEWVPRIALKGTGGYFFARGEHEIIEEETKCDGLLAINSEGAIDGLKFRIEVSKLLLTFGKPTVALIQKGEPTLHYLDNPEIRHVKFQRGEHGGACADVLRELRDTIEYWAQGRPGS
jgi:hypothetical protein